MLSDVTFDNQANEYATEKVCRDFQQGWQGIEYKLILLEVPEGIILL